MDSVLLRRIVRAIIFTLCRVEQVGAEHIPPSGGVLQAVNHLSWIDGPLIFAVYTRRDVTALAATKYRRNALSRWLLDSARVIWVDREHPEPRALKEAVRFMRQGGLVGIAPEGTRSKTGGLMPAKPGVAFLAKQAGVPIQAVGVTGTERVFRMLATFRRPRIRVSFSPVFELPRVDGDDRDEILRIYTDEIMCRIAALLPPEYRGVYTDHPRLLQLLKK
ncbi:MAG TPA: lysophospholipid acyltransferase family protein [Anaerolineales bacterium]|nr:lysophospholipid acyltransferase family protein [Anaerolineales bacterium]